MSERIVPTEYIDYYSSANTRKGYLNGLKRYLEIVTNTKITYSDLDDAWMQYLTNEKQDIAHDLIRFPRELIAQGYTPRTLQIYLKPVELYLKEIWEIELTDQQKRMRKRSEPKYGSVSKPANLKREQIAKLLQYSSIRMRFEILLAVSSGLRIGEILSLEFSDVDLESKPARVRVRAKNSKNKVERITHMSVEAVEAMKVYLDVRNSEVESGKNKASAKRARDSNRIIPYSIVTEQVHFRNTVEKAGLLELDETTGRSVIHFHSLRAFFSTRAHKSDAPDTFVEYLMGHVGYLTSAYWQPTDEDRAEMYAHIEPHVTIIVPDDYYEIKLQQANEIKELRLSLAHQQSIINSLTTTIEMMQDQQRVSGVGLHQRPLLPQTEDDDMFRQP